MNSAKVDKYSQPIIRFTHNLDTERCEALALVLVVRCLQDNRDPGIVLENTLVKLAIPTLSKMERDDILAALCGMEALDRGEGVDFDEALDQIDRMITEIASSVSDGGD